MYLKFFNHFKIVYQDRSSTITISDGLRKDTGMYKLRVENENGSDEAEAELVVLSPSAKPMGPLECEDILGMDSIITFFHKITNFSYSHKKFQWIFTHN